MKSMTGYGKGVAEFNGSLVTIEIKSVNHRFLDLNFKMPRTFCFVEDVMRNFLKSVFARGHFDIYINYEPGVNEEKTIEINLKALEKYMEMSDDILKKYNVINNLSVEFLLNQKDIVAEKEASANEDSITQLAMSALLSASQNLSKMRETEGEKISQNVFSKLEMLTDVVSKIKEFAPIQIQEYRDKLLLRVKDVLEESQIDDNRILNEVVLYADRVATDEEFTRLNAHIEHFKEICDSNDAMGRQLDFIVQEMNREANTIGSKCNDLSLSNYVLTLKTEIEKIREQVQNIE